MKTAYLLLAALMLAAALFSGCKEEKKGKLKPGRVVQLVEQTEEPMPKTLRPLTITTRVTEEHGCVIRYPYVTNSGMAVLNLSLLSAFVDFAENCELQNADVSCTVEFNKQGLLSLLMTCTSQDGRVMYEDAANFDCFTGLRLYLPDLFEEGSDHEARLSKLVVNDLENRGLELLSDLPPMDETRPFLFTYGGIYILYREYELTTHDAGMLRVLIRKSLISDMAVQDGPVFRLG